MSRAMTDTLSANSLAREGNRIQSQVQGDHFVITGGQFNQWNDNSVITNIPASKSQCYVSSEKDEYSSLR